jgi:hypothetical protein
MVKVVFGGRLRVRSRGLLFVGWRGVEWGGVKVYGKRCVEYHISLVAVTLSTLQIFRPAPLATGSGGACAACQGDHLQHIA